MKKSEAVKRLDEFIIKRLDEKSTVSALEIVDFIIGIPSGNEEGDIDPGLGFYPPLTKKGKYDFDAE